MIDAGLNTADEHEKEGGGAEQMPLPPSRSLHQTLGLAGTVLGLIVVAMACACGPLMILMAGIPVEGMSPGPAIQQTLALTVLGIGLGLVLAVEGWRSWQARHSPPFRPRRPWILWLIFLPLLGAGTLVSVLDVVPAYLLPPINTLTMLLLPALILGIVGRVLDGAGGSWRDVLGGLIGGASIGTGLSMIIEVGVFLLLVVVLAIVLSVGVIPGGIERLESLAERLQDPEFLADPQAMAALLNPGVIVAALAFFAVITPLVEETTKTLGMGIAGFRMRPSPARAFLLGVASGAGFALVENLLNGAVIDTIWGAGILARMAATLMHCATGGLMGWGWSRLWRARQPAGLVVAFVGAVTLHGIWNGLAIGTAFASLSVAEGLGNPTPNTDLAPAIAAMGAIMAVLAALMLAGMIWAGRKLAHQERQS